MADTLKRYRGKRDFARTPEPPGEIPAETGNRFVVHMHRARADHYDLRLELGGVLKSWAVPKGPSLDPADRRLAVETEDHPLAYADFEGVIPAGQYGAGPMIVWDRGIWAPMGDAEEGLRTGSLKFRLAGEKLRGGFMLARLRKSAETDKPAWLLIKEHDMAAEAGSDILAARPESVKSGRRIEELAAPAEKAEKPARKPARLSPARLAGAKPAPMPAALAPQLASPADEPPAGSGWLHEIKFDGYRALAFVRNGEARLVTRGGLDWTDRFGTLPAALGRLACKQALLDGEIVVLDEAGVSRFSALQQALSEGPGNRLVYFAFDLVHLDGFDLADVAVESRKALLAQLVAQSPTGAAVQFSDHVEGEGRALYERATEMGLEGIVSKRFGSPYRPGRSKAWLKAKGLKSGDFLIAGFTRSEAAGGIGALALAEEAEGGLAYRGKVGTGFDAAVMAALVARLEELRETGRPLAGAPKDVVWVRPELKAHIHYSGRTTDGLLRHSIFKRLGEAPADPAPTEAPAAPRPQRPRLISDADLATIWVTNPDRKLFGRSGATKLDVALYYAAVGEAMLPHLLDRPVSLVRCPTGKPEDCFFQRHAFTGMPASLKTFPAESSEGELKRYLAIGDARGYLALAQFGVVEFHVWGTRLAHLETPDRLVFDLDPGEGVGWREVVEAAFHIRAELQGMGLVPFVKTTGGKGIHVVVPIRPRLEFRAAHAASGRIAEALATTAPEAFVTNMAKARRKNRIFIDFHRNGRGATAAAPYTLRARAGLTASTPLDWAELGSIDGPEDLNYSSVAAMVAASGDPWAEIDAAARALPARFGAGS